MSTAAAPRIGIPLRPDPAARAREWRRSFVDDATVSVLARMRKTSADEVRMELRGAVTPTRVGDFPGSSVAKVLILADNTPLSEVVGEAIQIEMAGVASYHLVTPLITSQAHFIEENFPIPPATGVFNGAPVELPKKLATLAPISSDLESFSAPTASSVISQLLRLTISNGALGVMLSADAATPAAPAGILNSIPPIAAGASPAEDIKNSLGAISSAGISTRSCFFIVAADLAAVLETQAWPLFKRKVIEAPTLAPGTIICIAGDGFVVGADGTPVVDTSRAGLLHLADPALPISSTGSPDIAVPTISLFQTDSFCLRCVLRITWAVASGCVSWIENATW